MGSIAKSKRAGLPEERWITFGNRFNLAAIGNQIAGYQWSMVLLRHLSALGSTLAVTFTFWMLSGLASSTMAGIGMAGMSTLVVKLLKRDSEEVGFMFTTCAEPLICTFSYPVAMRGDLMRILVNIMKFDMDPRPGYCEINALHNASRHGYEEKVVLDRNPPSWMESLCLCCPQWQEFQAQLQDYCVDGEYLYDYSDPITPFAAPSWFVLDFAPAAFSSAIKSKTDGSGVILFAGWPGYFSSERCRLEFAFARVLAAKYPKSVYVYTGTDCRRLQHGTLHGYYLTGWEIIPKRPTGYCCMF